MFHFTLEPFLPEACCICGSRHMLSGEHKLKASLLRSEFGSEDMVILKGEKESRPEKLRSSKSRRLHFNSRICTTCNCKITQESDQSFHNFHLNNVDIYRSGCLEERIVNNYSDSYEKSEVLKYFGKLMACHIAECSAPRIKRLSKFIIDGRLDSPIVLGIRSDPTYNQYSKDGVDLKYAAHGGLAMYCDIKSGALNAFHSTVTFGPVQYIYYLRLSYIEKIEMILNHRRFVIDYLNIMKSNIENPPSNEYLHRVGLL